LVVTLRDGIVDVQGEGGWTAGALLVLDGGTALEQLAREATLNLS
jgi:hypothetical protein